MIRLSPLQTPLQTVRLGWFAFALVGTCFTLFPHAAAWAMPATIARGQPLPDATLVGVNNTVVALGDLKGRVTLFSIVPQLNTPVCDEQTHRFSEHKAEMPPNLEMVTISTNTHEDQATFADKAGIANITFLSDAPRFEFGRTTGLLYHGRDILQRAVLVADAHNVIRYLQIVPMGQLPNFAAAMDAARTLLSVTSFSPPAQSGPPQPIDHVQRLPRPVATLAQSTPPQPVNPHGSDPMRPPPGIIGVALHLTADRVGGAAGLFIRATHPMGPAVKAGLAHGQEILAVDGQSITGKTYREVVAMIRGAIGTTVTLLVKTVATVETVEIVRVGEDSLLKTPDPVPPGMRHS